MAGLLLVKRVFLYLSCSVVQLTPWHPDITQHSSSTTTSSSSSGGQSPREATREVWAVCPEHLMALWVGLPTGHLPVFSCRPQKWWPLATGHASWKLWRHSGFTYSYLSTSCISWVLRGVESTQATGCGSTSSCGVQQKTHQPWCTTLKRNMFLSLLHGLEPLIAQQLSETSQWLNTCSKVASVEERLCCPALLQAGDVSGWGMQPGMTWTGVLSSHIQSHRAPQPSLHPARLLPALSQQGIVPPGLWDSCEMQGQRWVIHGSRQSWWHLLLREVLQNIFHCVCVQLLLFLPNVSDSSCYFI